MKPFKHQQKTNSKTTKAVKQTTNDQSKNRTDHKHQMMIRRVIDEVFPENEA